MVEARKIHTKILDAFCDLKLNRAKGNRVKISPKAYLERIPFATNMQGKLEVRTFVIRLVYCGRVICQTALPTDELDRDCVIIKQPLYTSHTAMGYYRAFFDRDDIRVVKGEFKCPDFIRLAPVA